MRKKFMAVIMVLALLLSACGGQVAEGEAANTSEQSGADTDVSSWELKETVLPDANEALGDSISENGNTSLELLCEIVDDIIYRVVLMYGEEIEHTGICIQKLETPYTAWESVFIAADQWIDGEYCYVRNAALRQDESIHVLLESMNDAGEQNYYRAQWTESAGHTAEKISDEFLSEELLSGVINFYTDINDTYYFVSAEDVWYFDKAFSEKKEWAGTGYIWQIMEEPAAEEKVYLCGTSADGAFNIWTAAGVTPIFTSGDVVMGMSNKVAFAGETDGYLCTTEGIWKFQTKEGQTENVVSFAERGYVVDKVCGAWAEEDGSLLVVVVSEGEYLLLECMEDGQADTQELQSHEKIEESEETESQDSDNQENQDKVELELAAAFPNSFLREAVVSFNRHSEKYHIILREPEKGENYADFQTRIQAEVSSGGGPALLSDDVLDLKSAAEKGMLRDLTADFAEQKENILENVWACGEVNGVSYAIPYSFSVTTFVTSMDVVGEKESWTPEEMMQCVMASGAKTAVADVDSSLLFTILTNHGKLVDWEKGKSYLNSEEAVALLEFAGEYGDQGSNEGMGTRMEEGEVLVGYMTLSGLFFSQTMEALYQSREAYIGLPVEDGESGNIIVGDSFSINQACECPEGAIAFIQYLLTEESQDKFAKDASENGVSGFPVCFEALENMFVYAEELAEASEASASVANFMGFDFIKEPLSVESIEKIRKLLQNAKPETKRVGDISDIILEETPAYFSGNKSAQEVCDILQNRVQLYLDEIN